MLPIYNLKNKIDNKEVPKTMLPTTPKGKETSFFLVSDQICQRFSLELIRSATQNFDENLVLGRGGYGTVYKGFINHDGSNTIVAIKIPNFMSNQGALEFRNEVEMISKVRHCNLVSLIGYCHEGKEMALVYEYMSEGTLEDHLHKDGAPLSWMQLLKICIGAARGLEYLHTGTGTQHGIIHRDVKSSNVLLDKHFAAKISDFGLAKIVPTNRTRTHVSTLVKGTFGYFDPRYVHTGKLTRKSDVYSFGVLLLEVICGRPAVDTNLDEEDQWGLAPWAQERIKVGKLNHIIDSRLRGQISNTCLKEFTGIACRCLHDHPNQRPTMAEIVSKLEVILLLQKQLDSRVTEGKFIDKVRLFVTAKVELASSYINAPTQGGSSSSSSSEGEPNGKSGDDVNDVINHFRSIQTSGSSEGDEPSDIVGEARSLTEVNLKSFSYNVLKTATRNFWPDTILREDGLGSVYKGWINDHAAGTCTVIAVKRLNLQGVQDDQQWLAAINCLGLLNHPNLVKLIGYCLEGHHKLLVYNFMTRSSLQSHLLRWGTGFEPLSWNLRIKIALGAAKGLAYLHSQEAKLISCDIKSSCILVDSDHNAKLCNFLLIKHKPLLHHGSNPNKRYVDGYTDPETYRYKRYVDDGYAAPEYVPTGSTTTEREIYSFGVVLLEVLTGKRSIDNNRPLRARMLVDFAMPYLTSKRTILQILDRRIEGQYSPSVAIRVAMLAKRCISIEPRDRPTADEVVKALEELHDLQKASQVQRS